MYKNKNIKQYNVSFVAGAAKNAVSSGGCADISLGLFIVSL